MASRGAHQWPEADNAAGKHWPEVVTEILDNQREVNRVAGDLLSHLSQAAVRHQLAMELLVEMIGPSAAMDGVKAHLRLARAELVEGMGAEI